MHLSVNRIKKGLKGLSGYVLHDYPFMFDYDKKELIDTAFQKVVPHAKSLADLGGVYRIDGAYTFYSLDKYRLRTAFLVDTDFTASVRKRSRQYGNLSLIQDNFGNFNVAKKIERVDVIFLFEVLLHQVNPDWNQILEMYSSITDCFVVFNQQFIRSEKTVRLLDLGFDEYFEHVRVDRESPHYKSLVERTTEIHPQHNRPWRDVHNVWQWGITNTDLMGTMDRLGFTMRYHRNHGQFSNFKSFENHAFIFCRQGD
jgi:hypothetical protein